MGHSLGDADYEVYVRVCIRAPAGDERAQVDLMPDARGGQVSQVDEGEVSRFDRFAAGVKLCVQIQQGGLSSEGRGLDLIGISFLAKAAVNLNNACPPIVPSFQSKKS